MLQRFSTHIQKEFSYLKNKKLLIAISGGVDSVVLTHLLHQLNYSISLAHCNFKLRNIESDLDEHFIKDFSTALNIPVFTTNFDTLKYAQKKKTSIQLAARELRYSYFKELINKHSFDYVLTAHHADDNLETFLINLTRKTGLEGLTGIPSKNNNIIRPLLMFSRNDILNYAENNNVQWREDKSNSETKYLRNKIRHEIIPILKNINPEILTSFNQTSEYLNNSQQIIEDRIDILSKKIVSVKNEVTYFDIQEILKLKNPKIYVYQFLKTYGFTEWDNVFNLLTTQSGKRIETKTHIIYKNRNHLQLISKENSELKKDEIYQIDNNDTSKLNIPFNISIENTTKKEVVDRKTILLDKNLVFYPLFIRKKKEGDVFYPTGMTGKKKISKFFKDEKMSAIEKKEVWLLCDCNDQVIWIIGRRQDRRFKLNNNTKNITRISI